MIAVDTNVIAYLLLPGTFTKSAREVLLRDAEWAVPVFWRSEFRNVLAGEIRRGALDVSKAIEVQTLAEELVATREFAVDSAQVLELAAASGRSAYDCEFVVIARVLDVPLVTADRQILRSFRPTAVSLASFSA